jgi:hypothetical protein
VQGPDEEGQYVVMKLLSLETGRLLPFEEVQHYVEETVQATKSEAMLNDFLDRHRRRFRIEAHPDLTARIRLVDPTL